ncbi:MAG: oligosaccharide flippase family protein, partial [Leptospira sp.]|nr:oligosaccharide flippase family protein [Leptospira sp.]
HDKKIIGIILSSSLLIKFYSFLFLTFLGFISFLFFSEDPLLIFILIAGGLGSSFLTYFESIFIAFEAFYSLAVWNPMANIVRLGILYFANQYSPSPLNSIDIIAIFAMGPIFILLFFFLTFEKDRLNWGAQLAEIQQGTKDLALFNLWAFLASIFAIISDRLEIFIINKYHSPESVATYGTALQLFSGFVIILSTLNSVIYPRLAKYHNTKEFNGFLLKAVGGSACIAILLSPGFFLAEFILNLFHADTCRLFLGNDF